jgi:hypothetical protein
MMLRYILIILNIQLLTAQQGHTSNFANNALWTICHKVYYNSRSKSTRQFPTFQKTIPPKALILIATIMSIPILIAVSVDYFVKVRNILKIYAKQTSILDSEATYESILALYEHVNKDLYHGPKLCQMLQSWAAEGL